MEPTTIPYMIIGLTRWNSASRRCIKLSDGKSIRSIRTSLRKGKNLFDLVGNMPQEPFIDPSRDFAGARPDFYEIYCVEFGQVKSLKFKRETYTTNPKRVGPYFVKAGQENTFKRFKPREDIEKAILLKPEQLISEEIERIRSAIRRA